jgi:hypothetical protein
MDCRVKPGNDNGEAGARQRTPPKTRDQSFARSTYDPSSVITTTRVPGPMNGGMLVRTPFDSVAGL